MPPRNNGQDETVASDEQPVEPRRMTPLQRLVYDSIRAQDLDYSEVARLAGVDTATGKPRLSRQRVQQIVKKPIARPPSPVTIRGLAVALRLPEGLIREHVSESLNLRTLRDGPSAELNEILDMVERLPPADQERWARLSRNLAHDLAEFPASKANPSSKITIDVEAVENLRVATARLADQEQLPPETREELRSFAQTIMFNQ